MTYFKYPRTPHLPYSLTKTTDDKVLSSDEHFYAFDSVVVTEKMDGENTTVYSDGKCHARSIDSKHAEYHSWLLNYVQNWYYKLKPNQRICGEYLYAEHSIKYEKLMSYFYGFSFWETATCMDWQTTFTEFNELLIYSVPVLYLGKYNTEKINNLFNAVVKNGGEGIVVRNAGSFHYDDFGMNVAKAVRPNHVQTSKHWSQQQIKQNKLEMCNG